jgi:hypothetical protein
MAPILLFPSPRADHRLGIGLHSQAGTLTVGNDAQPVRYDLGRLVPGKWHVLVAESGKDLPLAVSMPQSTMPAILVEVLGQGKAWKIETPRLEPLPAASPETSPAAGVETLVAAATGR